MSGEWHRMSALALGAGIGSGAIDPRALTEYFLERIEEVRRRPCDLPAHHRRPRPRRGRGRPPTCPNRTPAVSAGRRADLVEGPLRQCRGRHQPRHSGAGGPCRNRRRKGSGPRHPSWAGVPGQDEPDRVRLLHPRSEPQDGHPAQPLRRGRRAYPWRVVFGRRRFRLARPRRCRHRFGHRRLRACAGGLERASSD